MPSPRVLLTGASGSMGFEAFLELRRRSSDYSTRLILRPSQVNRKMFARYLDDPGLEIVWGDLTNPDDVERAVEGVDFVLHPAAMISPGADQNPAAAREINVGGTENILASILRQPDGAERIRLVSVGSVAQYGDRLPPREWIRVGDPLIPSVHDHYALTKCEAEKQVVESGLRPWASLRQTFIVPPKILSLLDSILFHQPLEQRIEFITSRDAGYGLVQCLDAPEDFWGRIYNMSGGPACRIDYEQFIDDQFRLAGLGDYRKIFERNWFALKNFHCGYFEDSGELDHYLGHFRDDLSDTYAMIEEALRPWMKWGARLAPAPLLNLLARRWAEPLQWIAENDDARIKAFFGSREAWEGIPGWDWARVGIPGGRDARAPSRDDRSGHTFRDIGREDLVDFAHSRGGSLLSSDFEGWRQQHRWRCALKHEFQASPVLLLEGGYWCPECFPCPEVGRDWGWDHQAEVDPLLGRFYGKGSSPHVAA